MKSRHYQAPRLIKFGAIFINGIEVGRVEGVSMPMGAGDSIHLSLGEDIPVSKPVITPEIMLSNGRYYNFEDGDVSGVTIEVIAHALSHICRFTGHTSRFYSVAEHCVRASYIGPLDEALERLMHDASEHLVGDVATPLKINLGPGYAVYEERAEVALAAKFNYRYPYPPSVKTADRIMLATEKRDLLPHETRQWKMLELVQPLKKRIPRFFLAGLSWYWKRRFIRRYKELAR